MNEQWQNDDEVTTTYGSIQLSLRQAYSAGTITERNRIVDLLMQLPVSADVYKVIQQLKGEVVE
jgi:hypothetical protein